MMPTAVLTLQANCTNTILVTMDFMYKSRNIRMAATRRLMFFFFVSTGGGLTIGK